MVTSTDASARNVPLVLAAAAAAAAGDTSTNRIAAYKSLGLGACSLMDLEVAGQSPSKTASKMCLFVDLSRDSANCQCTSILNDFVRCRWLLQRSWRVRMSLSQQTCLMMRMRKQRYVEDESEK
jgi:hypothetical protein